MPQPTCTAPFNDDDDDDPVYYLLFLLFLLMDEFKSSDSSPQRSLVSNEGEIMRG